MVDFSSLLSYVTNNGLKEYSYAIGVFLISLVVLRFFKFVVIKKLGKIFSRTKTDWDDALIRVINSFGWVFFFFISVYLSIQFLTLPEIVNKVVFYILVIVGTYYAVKATQAVIDFGTRKIISKARKGGENVDTTVIDLLGKILKVVVWIIAILLILTNLGYEITPLIAGLGVGGIAIAFALQNILGDIFASVSIYFDKPFKVGDYIVVGADSGTVKKIGIKSTRIQTLQGDELVVSNKELTETRVRNYKKMQKRRISFGFGVVYDTSSLKMKRIPTIIKGIFDKVNGVSLDRVHFKEFGDSALVYEVVYYLDSNDYGDYMDAQQEINLQIKEKFERDGIEMAYPTQTLYVHGLKK